MNISCRQCAHFVTDPGELETIIPGLNIVSSAYGSVRADTAYCKSRDIFLTSIIICPAFKPLLLPPQTSGSKAR
jgi:hypothetical protein